jgi:hypothetical protein
MIFKNPFRSLLSLALLASLAAPALASDKLIYNFSGKLRATGDSLDFAMPAKGQLIWDPATNEMTTIATISFGGHKGVEQVPMSGQQVFVIKGASGKEYTVIAVAQTPDLTDPSNLVNIDVFKGRRFNVVIGATTFVVPKTMTETARSIGKADSGETAYAEAGASYSLDVKASAASNAQGETLQQAAARIKQSYLLRGYEDMKK